MSEYEKSRILNLDLLYPAVLGSLLFMMFLRFANQGWLAFSEAGTWLGVVVAVFFSIGFLNAKLDSNYGLSDSLMDLLSSIIVFLAYFLLNFAELDASKTDDSNISFGHVYWIMLIAAVLPFLRRWLGGTLLWNDRKNMFVLASVIPLALGIVIEWGYLSAVAFLSPGGMAATLVVISAIYVWQLAKR